MLCLVIWLADFPSCTRVHFILLATSCNTWSPHPRLLLTPDNGLSIICLALLCLALLRIIFS